MGASVSLPQPLRKRGERQQKPGDEAHGGKLVVHFPMAGKSFRSRCRVCTIAFLSALMALRASGVSARGFIWLRHWLCSRANCNRPQAELKVSWKELKNLRQSSPIAWPYQPYYGNPDSL